MPASSVASNQVNIPLCRAGACPWPAGNTQPIRVLNPIASPLSVMRTSLIGSLVSVLRFNLARKASRVRLFEVGRVFRRDDTVQASLRTVAGIDQPLRVAGIAYGPADALQWSVKERSVDFYDVKGDIEALFAPRRTNPIPGSSSTGRPT